VVSCFRPCTQFFTWLMHMELDKRGSWCLFSMIACSLDCCLQSGKEIHCQVSDVVWNWMLWFRHRILTCTKRHRLLCHDPILGYKEKRELEC
jgi:hypothetical protein